MALRSPVITSGPIVRPIDASEDPDVARLVESICGPVGMADALRYVRDREGDQVLAIFVESTLVGAYVLVKNGMANEVRYLLIHPEHRHRGYGRMCLMDALLRSGRRPLVVEANDETFPFYKAVGFKIVGKRKARDGSNIFRLGWHAPMPKTPGGEPVPC